MLPPHIVRFFVLVFIFSLLRADQPEEKRKTVCLNMIVKNESPVIKRCLASVKGIIDHWVIVDTGSTDGTQKIIRDFMKDIPGELYERPWVDFGHNRNEALALAKNKGDYLLFIDADEQLIFSDAFIMPRLEKDCYFGIVKVDNTRFKRALLVNNKLDWKWEGAIHEHPVCFQAKSSEVLKGVINSADATDGHRALDPQKCNRDIQILKRALEKEPANSRYVFYLAQTYVRIKEYSLALKNYEKRSTMGGDPEELFWSLFMMAEIRELRKTSQEIVIDSYWKAYYARTARAEPLFRLSDYYCKIGKYKEGYVLAKFGLSINLPEAGVNLLPWVYDYGFLCVLAECAFHLKKYDEAEDALIKVLAKLDVIPETRKQAENSLEILRTLKR